jgi:hypothetical protein
LTPGPHHNPKEANTHNTLPAGLVSGGSYFPHKGRRKIGQPFLHTQYSTSSAQPQPQSLTQKEERKVGPFQHKMQGSVIAQPVATAPNHRIFSKPHTKNAFSQSKEEFKNYHILPQTG